jgi:F0F1-type ATP synthase membrane subunit b/b'
MADEMHGELSSVLNNAMKWMVTRITAIFDERLDKIEKRLAKIEKQTKAEDK